MKPGKAAVKAEKKEMKASVKAMTPPAKSKPGVSPNPMVTGNNTLPKLSGLVGGVSKTGGTGGTVGFAPKMAAGPKRTPAQAISQSIRNANVSSKANIASALAYKGANKAGMGASTSAKKTLVGKPAMPSRKK